MNTALHTMYAQYYKLQHVKQFKVSVQLRGAKKFPALLVLLVGPSVQGRRQRMSRELVLGIY